MNDTFQSSESITRNEVNMEKVYKEVNSEDTSSDEDTEDTEHEDSEDELEDDCYVIYVNNIVTSYVKDEDEIFEKLFAIARDLASKEFFNGYRTQCVAISKKEFHVVGTYLYFIIGYETILHRITYKKISKYKII